ncbi:hypothetical protein GPECTOR_20g549 [Gonium pectorale]|uniref:Uncharacterized protein n=1 Tax=Gonium pectorale TaxID=33097 RepID=A0A150GIR1_GONPE|nr:hypothetical protein GPECTOR_20g549 [Gonium pectorale]|eukprot:KXZ49692.1 hypothetical protein GPECTOR_20g549 [Gonium pectorale]
MKRHEELRQAIADEVGVPAEKMRTPASYLRQLSEVAVPNYAIAKLRALLGANGPFADPDQRPLFTRMLLANPHAVLTIAAVSLNRKVDNLVELLEFAPPPPAAKAGGKAAAAAAAWTAARVRVLRVAARDPRILKMKPETFKAKLAKLEALVGRGHSYAMDMVHSKPALMACYSSDLLAAKMALLKSVAEGDASWAAELEYAEPARMAQLLTAGMDKLARLRYLSAKKMTSQSMQKVIRTSIKDFDAQHRDFPAWLARQPARSPTSPWRP